MRELHRSLQVWCCKSEVIDMELVKVTINGKECAGEKGEYLLDIANRNGITIPHLCHHESLRGLATCRMCIVEINENGKRKTVTSCIYPVTKDTIVETDTENIRLMRKTMLGLLMAEVPGNQEISKLAKEYGISDFSRYHMDFGNECILCGLCVRACEAVGCNAIGTVNRGTTKKVTTPYEEPSAACIGCGSCAYVCPTGHIKVIEEYGIRKIWNRDFELIRCGVCGKHFITKEEFAYLKGKTGIEEAPICKTCKQMELARKLMGI